MRIEAQWFGGGIYERMARVLEATARTHCPDWTVNVTEIDVNDLQHHDRAKPSHVANTQKMESWNRIVQNAADGERLLLMDADTFILRPLDDVWNRDFDLAYTTKDSRFPFNSGVVFIRVNDNVRRFFARWAETNRAMLRNAHVHQPWRARFGGINQAALGRMLERKEASSLRIAELPCVEWNCEDSAWSSFDPERTRIVHVKSRLRMAVETPSRVWPKHIRRLADIWHRLEADKMERAA